MGFKLSEFVQGEKWRTMMKYLYAWGASLVLTGALFKLMYRPAAGVMLTIGMSTEVIIFFFSGFEPLPDEVDWTLVYPELTGMSDEEELRKYRKGTGLEGIDADDLKEIIASAAASFRSSTAAAPAATTTQSAETAAPQATGTPQPVASTGNAGAVFSKFNQMLESADLSPELFNNISKGLNKLSDTTAKLSDISDAAKATSAYTNNINKANDSIANFVQNYEGSGQALNESVNILSENFQKVAGTISESGENFKGGLDRSVGSIEEHLSNAGEKIGEKLIQSSQSAASQIGDAANGLTSMYTQLAEAMKVNGEFIAQGSTGYQEQLDRLNKNMSALNAAHELHLQGTSEKLKESQAVYDGVESMMGKLKTSIEETEKYSDSVAKLNQSISSLNTVYGNMLSAMNVANNNA